MAMENPPFMDGFPIETSIYMGFPIAMFDYRRVNQDTWNYFTARVKWAGILRVYGCLMPRYKNLSLWK